jgi:hypothetical protein
METPESGFVENKGVPACKRIGASQFPFGDDVSYVHPLRSSVPFVLSYTAADETDRRSLLRHCAGVDWSHDAKNPPLDLSKQAVCFR